MPVNRKALGEAERGLRRQSTRAADELRSLRLRAGLSQAAVAREIGVARSVVTRLEAGDTGITLRTRFRIATALGAELRLNVYAGSGPLIRDAAQAGIIESILARADVRWRQTVEASVPGPGSRSVDLRLIGPNAIVLIEVEVTSAASRRSFGSSTRSGRLSREPQRTTAHRSTWSSVCRGPGITSRS